MKIIIYQNREVYKEDSKIGNDSENKVETLEFEFPEEYKDFTKYIEFQVKGEKYVDLIENDKYTITRAIAKYGKIKAQIVLRNSIENDVAVFKSDVFELKVSNSINATIDVPIEYPTWIDNLTRLKQDIEKSEEKRVSNENERQMAEANRKEDFTQMQKNVESAINNIEDMTDAYNRNAIEKTNDFNNNVTSKTEIFDANAASKTDVFNQNSTNKTTAFNENAQKKIDEFNTNAAALENRVSNLETDNANNKQDILNIKAEQNTQNTKLTDLENKNVEQDAEITNIKAEQDTQNNKLNNIENINTAQGNSIQELQKNIADLQSYNETNDTNILNIQSEQEEQNNSLTMLKASDYSQDKLIEDLQNQIIDLETENENIKNQIPTGQAEGENITLNDSSDMEFKEFVVGGNSWQETRSGKNKFDSKIIPNFSGGSSGVNLTIDDEGVVTIFNNTNSSGYVNTTKKLKELCPLLKVGDVAYLYLETTHTTKQIWLNGSSEAWVNGNSKTITQSMLDGIVSLYGGNIQTDTLKIQVTLNEPSSAYEQYGAMPSPEFRSEIRNVNGSANITVCNKNFFDINQVNNLAIGSSYGKPSCVMEDSTFRGYTLNLDKNQTKITISRKNITDFNRFRFGFTDMLPITEVTVYNDNWVEGFIEATTLTSITFSIPIQAKYLFCYFSNVNEEITEEAEIQIEYGEKTEYQPHQSQQFTFPLAEGQRMYKDSYLADDGIEHNRGYRELDGTETINIGANYTNTTRFIINSIVGKIDGKVLCNYLVEDTAGKDEPNIDMHGVSGSIVMTVPNSIATTVEQLKAYLAEQYANGTPVTVEYELAEEVIEPYTEEQQLVYNEIKKAHSYKNVTHIFSTDEIKPQIEVVYRKDWETLNQKQEDRILALENAVLGGN